MSELVVLDEMSRHIRHNAERRRAERRLCNRVCFARSNGTSAGILWGIQVFDISKTGISVLLKQPMPIGTMMAIQPFRDSQVATLYGQVVQVHTFEDRWLHGCEFSKELTDDELQYWCEIQE